MDVFGLLKSHAKRLGEEVKLIWLPRQVVIVMIYSEKGGVGKTALVNGIAAVMGAAGFRVLVIDLDPRATATDELGVTDPPYSVNDLLYVDPSDDDPAPIRGMAADAIISAGDEWPESVHLLASERALGNREMDLTPNMEQRLALALDGVADKYHIVLMDVPPRPGGKLAAAASAAATHALIPATLTVDGYIGVVDALTTIRKSRRTAGRPDLPVIGALRNIVDRRYTQDASDHDRLLGELNYEFENDRHPVLLSDIAVPSYVVRRESRTLQVPITVARSPEARAIQQAYIRVANKISERAVA